MLEGLIPSIGTVGDALDNALCETTIGLYRKRPAVDAQDVWERAARLMHEHYASIAESPTEVTT